MVVFVVSKRLHAKIQHFLQKGCIIMEKEELQKKASAPTGTDASFFIMM